MMAKAEDSKRRRGTAAIELLREMEDVAADMRALIVAQPPQDLLGYIYVQRVFQLMSEDENETPAASEANAGDVQFLLEYVHAVLASDAAPAETKFDEAACGKLFELGRKLKMQAIFYAMASSADTVHGVFGTNTAEIEFRAKSGWVLLRGHRHQVLEGEFYAYVLAPHDDVLRKSYGIGSAEIAAGFQAMADASRAGQGKAFEELARHFDAAQDYADEKGKAFQEVAEEWGKAHAHEMRSAALAMDDMVRGGITNVSRHTALPQELLADLSYRRGEGTDFFDEGQYAGTPFRTLPVRKKPLIQLGEDYYAVDPCFTRDAGYSALLWNLRARNPDYKKTFLARQKEMSEAAFADILSAQLRGATVYQEVYYRDVEKNEWVENDTLVVIDDVLFLVEAKSGFAATIASPALDFDRHVQAVQDLLVKAYQQCKRFFDYLNSADEVSIFKQVGKRKVPCGKIRRSDFRAMFPIGLTVESFSPFSAYFKELPEVTPLLGKHAFISLSIDDLFVLRRFLPTLGEFAHYLEVRQAVAGLRGAHLFDELDHLGAYIGKNRFDIDLAAQLSAGARSLVIWDGMSDVVDQHFTGGDWETRPVPAQAYPKEVERLLDALERSRYPGWLSVESHIRTYGEEGRRDLAKMLADFGRTLLEHPSRYFMMMGEPSFFVWLQRAGVPLDRTTLAGKASAAAIRAQAANMIGVVVEADTDGSILTAQRFPVVVPSAPTAENEHIYADAVRMARPKRSIRFEGMPALVRSHQPGRNDPCWCGSGIKYKRCHGG